VIGAGSTIGGNVFLMQNAPPKSPVLYDVPTRFWTAVAERSGDTALLRVLISGVSREWAKSGVALRFPPQSMGPP